MSTSPDDRMTEDKPVSGLIADALQQFSRLMRNEFALAKAELVDKGQTVARSAAMIAGGGLLVLPSLVLVLMALAALMTELGMRASLAYLLSGLIGLAIGGALAWSGVNRLKAGSLMPQRTIGQLQRDAATAKEHL